MQILDGKIVSQAVKDAIKIKTTALKSAGKKTPHLAAIIVAPLRPSDCSPYGTLHNG